MLDVTDPTQVSFVTHVLSTIADNCIPGDAVFSALQNMGMDFTLDETKLLIANPDQDRVDVLDVQDGDLQPPIVNVGVAPTDIVVVRTFDETSERAYVASRGDHTIRIIEVDDLDGSLTLLPDFIQLAIPGQELLLEPVAIDARSDGKYVFTSDNAHATVTVANIDPASDQENLRVETIPVGMTTTRLALLSSPVSSSCGNGICESGEDCGSCSADCAGEKVIDGNGICEAGNGEDCSSAPMDCKYATGGSPDTRCCGESPSFCDNNACTNPPYQCTTTPVLVFCCGNGMIDPGEVSEDLCDGNP